jgi:lipopolysaccharide/colanic/teichoic acid biosynthesis glycosyltransferase
MITEFREGLAAPQARVARVPERISRAWRIALLCGDAAVLLFVNLIVFSSVSNWFAAAVVMSGILCGSFALCNLYKRSYAVVPRDEAYYACTAIVFGAPATLLVLASIGQIGIGLIFLALLLSALATSALRIRLHLERRCGPAPERGIACVTPLAWHDRESASFLLGKRTFDVIAASLALVVTFPLMLFAALAITLDSGAPVLFRQERVGRNGRVFSLFKFRTMRPDAGNEWARPGDDRITRIGALLRRTSIDELPQIFNVLRGDMSMVGPRPEMVSFAKRFENEVSSYDQRHIVNPGMTGWAQMYCRRNLLPDDVADVLPCDLFYVEHASVVIDCAMVFKTIAEVLFQRAV